MAQKKRLAETLVEEGVITEIQLQNALQRQLIMGGKIGTNLIELGYIKEEQLDKILSKMYRVPFAFADSFSNIPPDVINSIPKELAIKYRIIPIKKEYKHLVIAMENPNDFNIIDEVSFLTGCRITAVVASEARIALALERYYGYQREVRYIKIEPPQEEFVIEKEMREAAGKEEPPVENHGMVIIRNSEEEWLGGKEEEAGQFADYYKIKESLTSEPIVAPAPIQIPAPAVPGAKTFEDTVNELLKIETRDDAIRAVLEYISQYVDNVIFLVISAAEAKAWSGRCKDIDAGKLSDLKINFGGPSAFLTVKNNEQTYYGEISNFPFDDDFLSEMRRKRPLKILLIPLMVKTRMVAMLYVDNNGKEMPAERVKEINSIIEKLSIAFEIMILKKKTGSR